MSLKSYMKFVELQTKIASVVPFLLGTLYMFYRFETFNFINFMLFFISLVCFDMATTAINNYTDFKTAIKKDGYGYEEHNAIVKYNIKPSTALHYIIILVTVAIICGFLLFLNTNIIVLLVGIVSFGVGILYTYGPVPISRTPFGELLSGSFMGFVITFLAVYIHVFDSKLLIVILQNNILTFSLDLLELIYLFIFSVPLIMCISNIMLANNICDINEDIVNNRKTLPICVGENNALKLFSASYFISYLSIIATVILKILPTYYLLGLLSIVFVYKNITVFNTTHVKSKTFVIAIKNFIAINMLNFILLFFITII